MLIDLHGHTSGISRCCKLAAPDILRAAQEVGLDGIVLTNHYQESYLEGGSFDAFADKYIREYYETKEWGEKLGCKVFLGAEVTMNFWPSVHLLVYGADEDFLRHNPCLYRYSQKELYTLVRENGCALVQGHPYRNGCTVLDTDYLDGVEVNCHPLYDGSHEQELYAIAQQAGIMLTCGGDYHGDSYRPHCGTYLPDWVQDEHDLARFILTADHVRLHIQEVNDPVHADREFTLPRAEKYRTDSREIARPRP